MKIYFAGAIRGGRDDQDLYLTAIRLLGKHGTVLTEHIGDTNLSHLGETQRTNEDIYTRDVAWIQECDVVVAEVSIPSLGVGYEIGHAESHGKKIICLYREQEGRRLSAMLSGNRNVRVEKYNTVEDLDTLFKNFFL
ncbi:nucleoside 2-deoxyribosyltransferase [Candidatus Kaiserbacteria bacterium]|nr:nucleoside 2-deoxyribosyltransferase [Candidatus Kaiserbacteria bacterium]